jgi:cytochrome c553
MRLRINSIFRDLWARRIIALTAAIFVVTALLGFIALPFLQPDVKFAGLWDAICSAAGVAKKPTSTIPVAPDFKISSVIVTPQMLSTADAQSIGRGATLAHQCAICHGPAGFSRADAPNLAGQYASVIYKELKDFQSGARSNAIMTPFAAKLTEQDIVDLASYYAYLPRLPDDRSLQEGGVPQIVSNGAPLRNIPPCGSCHGSIENKIGSPWLYGQPAAYIKRQLQAFALGERHNDISQQMRNIARRLTPHEIDEAARYYSSLSQPVQSTER